MGIISLNGHVNDYWSHSHQGRLHGLAVACWTTDHHHVCLNPGVGISEGYFVSLPLEVARPIYPTLCTKAAVKHQSSSSHSQHGTHIIMALLASHCFASPIHHQIWLPSLAKFIWSVVGMHLHIKWKIFHGLCLVTLGSSKQYDHCLSLVVPQTCVDIWPRSTLALDLI